MKVLITNKKTGASISIPGTITLGALNYKVQESDYFDEACNIAVEDELVTKDSRQDYNFELERENDHH